MSTEFTRTSLRLAAAAVLAGGLAACSTMQSIDPTGLLGDDGSSASSDTGGLSDAGAGAADDTAQPDVASIPDRPEAPSSADENAQVANSLQADAANVQYSAESLRGGTEASAPPPPASAGAPAPGATDTTTPANTQVAEATPAQPPAAPPPPDTSADVATADVPADNITPGTTNTAGPLTEAPAQPAAAPPPSEPAPGDVASVPDETVAAPVSDDTATQTASADTAPTTEASSQPAAAPAPETSAPADTAAAPQAAPEPSADTAVASAPAQPAPAATPDAAPAPAPTQVASAAPVPGAQAPVTRRAAPGFAPSNAPPLDPSVSQFVAAPVVARYKQTAMLKPSVYPDYTNTPGYFGPATAIVVFPGDTTILDDKGLQQVRAAAELFKSHGGQGYVRIVGYASATSGNLSDARLMHINFDHSQARATAIARALMKEGVPAKKVLVDAAPQTASVAKAEIFVQG